MRFKNKQFEKNLCQAFACDRRKLPERLLSVEQIEINGGARNTLKVFGRDESELLRSIEIPADSDNSYLADLNVFENLRGIRSNCRKNIRKLFVHNWPVGISSIVWQDTGDSREELIANLERFDALSQLTLYGGTRDTVWPKFPAAVKSRLRQFSIKHLDCRHLEGFNSLVNLNLTIPENFKDMPRLESVKNFTGVCLHGIDGVQAMPNLEQLAMGDCNISSIAPLSALEKLREAVLSRNYIHDLSPISGLREIDTFMLSDNLIEDISPLSGLPLSYLDLSHNPIEDITALGNCAKLEYLDLRDTFVNDISVLSGLENLRELYVDVERLKDRKQLAALSHVEIINGVDFGECLWFYKVNC